MADIAKCAKYTCPSRDTCYRYRVKANDQYQSFASFSPEGDIKCDYYWNIYGCSETILDSVEYLDECNVRMYLSLHSED